MKRFGSRSFSQVLPQSHWRRARNSTERGRSGAEQCLCLLGYVDTSIDYLYIDNHRYLLDMFFLTRSKFAGFGNMFAFSYCKRQLPVVASCRQERPCKVANLRAHCGFKRSMHSAGVVRDSRTTVTTMELNPCTSYPFGSLRLPH